MLVPVVKYGRCRGWIRPAGCNVAANDGENSGGAWGRRRSQ
jgi:hypothetical protein